MDVEKTVKKIAKEYDKKVASDMRRAAIEQAAKTGLQKLRAAEKISSMTGMTTAEVLLSNLLELYPDGAIPAEEAKALIVPALKHNYDYVSPIVEEAHQQINKEAGIGLKPVVPEFDRDRADGIAADLAKAENIAEHAETLQQQVENQSRNIVDASIRENVKAHTRAGLDAKVIRKYDGRGLHNGKTLCKWCFDRDGEWSYSEAMARGVFQRHPGCGCEILYRTQKGWERQKDWTSNQWENISEEARYNIEQTMQHTELENETYQILKKYIKLATPNKGKYEIEAGYKTSKYSNEKKYADIIFKRFGGDIELLVPSDTRRRADYIWNQRFWEHKTVSSLTSVDNQIRSGLGQIKDNPGGLVLQMTKGIDLGKLKTTIIHRLNRSARDYNISAMDVLVFNGEDIVLAVEWNKK